MTYIDKVFNLYFQELGGQDFLGLVFAIMIIITILSVIFRNFET